MGPAARCRPATGPHRSRPAPRPPPRRRRGARTAAAPAPSRKPGREHRQPPKAWPSRAAPSTKPVHPVPPSTGPPTCLIFTSVPLKQAERLLAGRYGSVCRVIASPWRVRLSLGPGPIGAPHRRAPSARPIGPTSSARPRTGSARGVPDRASVVARRDPHLPGEVVSEQGRAAEPAPGRDQLDAQVAALEQLAGAVNTSQPQPSQDVVAIAPASCRSRRRTRGRRSARTSPHARQLMHRLVILEVLDHPPGLPPSRACGCSSNGRSAGPSTSAGRHSAQTSRATATSPVPGRDRCRPGSPTTCCRCAGRQLPRPGSPPGTAPGAGPGRPTPSQSPAVCRTAGSPSPPLLLPR